MRNKLFSIAILTFLGIFLLSFTSSLDQTTPWKVPEKYDKMENPNEATAASITAGKKLYNLHCKSCHGKEGLGDGTKAAQLDTACGDFTDEVFTAQSDGAIFYKSKFGRDDMPSFEKKIQYDEDIWDIVNYIRTLE